MHRSLIAVASLALAATPLAVMPAASSAGSGGGSGGQGFEVLARGLVAPLSLDVTSTGTVWFSQNFAGVLMRARPGKAPEAVYASSDGSEVGAVSFRRGTVTFATTSADGSQTALHTRSRNGSIDMLADLSGYEGSANPDAGQTYGVDDLDPACEAKWPVGTLGPATYQGIVESHPYASLSVGHTRYVADAAANAILEVAPNGSVSTAAVLPPQPAEITADAAAGLGIPACAVGHVYDFEPVPTDVERGKNGMLYVTLLPGGPEDPSLGARASVLRVNPWDGSSHVVATGLLSATGLAVADNGTLYVAELFGGRIAKIPPGASTPVGGRMITMPGDVEIENGRLYATRRVLNIPRGQVVRLAR
jgi:hypothetical protein